MHMILVILEISRRYDDTRSRSVVKVIKDSKVITDPACSPHSLGSGFVERRFLLACISMLGIHQVFCSKTNVGDLHPGAAFD